jgi:hypothetical protein
MDGTANNKSKGRHLTAFSILVESGFPPYLQTSYLRFQNIEKGYPLRFHRIQSHNDSGHNTIFNTTERSIPRTDICAHRARAPRHRCRSTGDRFRRPEK